MEVVKVTEEKLLANTKSVHIQADLGPIGGIVFNGDNTRIVYAAPEDGALISREEVSELRRVLNKFDDCVQAFNRESHPRDKVSNLENTSQMMGIPTE